MFLLFGLFTLSLVAACSPTFNEECVSSLDCFSDEICGATKTCVLKSDNNTNNTNNTNNMLDSITSIEILPISLEIPIGTSSAYTATATDKDANTVEAQLTWTSADPTIATVNESGVVKGVKVGTTKIIATAGMVSGEADVVVVPVIVDKIIMNPENATITTNKTAPFTAQILAPNGNAITDRTIAWSTTNENIITVDQDGLVTALAPGIAQVIALVDTVQGFAEVTVENEPIDSVELTPTSASIFIGDTTQLAAVAKSADDSDLPNRVITWSTSDNRIATVDMNGLVTAVAPGVITITAEAEGKTAKADITVAVVPVDRVEIGPAGSFTVSQDESLILTAKAFDAADQEIIGRTVSWSTTDPLIATVGGLGEVNLLDVGMTTIVVEIDGITATAMLTITPSAVATITLSAIANEVSDNETRQVTAELRDSANNTLTGRTIVWTSDDPTIATVDSNGLILGVDLGTTIIRANAEGIEATFTIEIIPGPPVSVEITPASATLDMANPTIQLTAILLDNQGNIAVDQVIWSSSDASVVSVDVATGLATRVGPGTAIITAFSEGFIGTSVITVTN